MNTKNEIRSLTMDSNFHSTQFNSMNLLYSNLNDSESINYSYLGNYIVWSNVKENRIYIAPLNKCRVTSSGINEKKVLINDNILYSSGIAIDWIHDLVYWIDSEFRSINVANITNPNMRYTLINNTVEEPHGIAVNPIESFIVWWCDNDAIYKSYQNGSNKKKIVDVLTVNY